VQFRRQPAMSAETRPATTVAAAPGIGESSWREILSEVVKCHRFQNAFTISPASSSYVARIVEEEFAKLMSARSSRTEDARELGPQLGKLLDSGRFADVIVRVGQEEEIRAHSAILAARSHVFDAMWSSGMKEEQQKEVCIKDLEPTAVRRMLRFLYTGALDVKLEADTEAISLLEVAHQYDVASLVELCVVTLSSWLTEDKAAEYLMIAEHLGLAGFRQRCLEFITSSHGRVSEVQATEGFASLAQRRPELAVEILAKAIPPAKRARATGANSGSGADAAASGSSLPASSTEAASTASGATWPVPPASLGPTPPPPWRPPPAPHWSQAATAPFGTVAVAAAAPPGWAMARPSGLPGPPPPPRPPSQPGWPFSAPSMSLVGPPPPPPAVPVVMGFAG